MKQSVGYDVLMPPTTPDSTLAPVGSPTPSAATSNPLPVPDASSPATAELSPADLFYQRCLADYLMAEITTVAVMSKGAAPTHLLGVVELLPPGLELNPMIGLPPDLGGYPRRQAISQRVGTLLVQRWHLPIAEALTWYRACPNGSMAVPGHKPGTVNNVALQPLGDDPPWPFLVTEEQSFWPSTDFWGARPGGALWHRMLTVEPVDVTQGWSLEDWQKAREFLREQIHIDLLDRPMLLGSVHLLLPNPLYCHSSYRVGDDWKSVELELTPYPGKSLDSLEIIVWNRRAWGVTSVVRQPITGPRTIVPLPEGVEETAHAVICKARGLLSKEPDGHFIASFQIGMNIVAERRKVKVPNRKGEEPVEYTVNVSSPAETVVAGRPRPMTVRQRLFKDENAAKSRKAWDALEVKWFEKDADAARQELHDVIGRAQKTLDLLDPYFGMRDLLTFALATTVRSLPVRVLTAADFCKTFDNENNKESGDLLWEALQQIRRQAPTVKIEIRVMRGQKSPVHDRFLITDGIVRVLGASLNEFGNRGTLLVRLPEPPPKEKPDDLVLSIPDDIFKRFWERAELSEPLEEFVERRAQERQSVSWRERLRQTRQRLQYFAVDVREIWRA